MLVRKRSVLGLLVVYIAGCSSAVRPDLATTEKADQDLAEAASSGMKVAKKEVVSNAADQTPPVPESQLFKPKPHISEGMISFQKALVQLVAETEEGREPYFDSKQTNQGVRILSNRNGRRYAFELVGQRIEMEKPDWQFWTVDGTRIGCRFDEELVETQLPGQATPTIRNILDANLAAFREKRNLELVESSQEELTTRTGHKAWYGQLSKSETTPQVAGQPGSIHVAVASLGNGSLVVMIAAPARDEFAKEKRELAKRTILSVEKLPDLPSDRAPLTADDLLQTGGLNMSQDLRLSYHLLGEPCGALLNADLASNLDRKNEHAIVLPGNELMSAISAYLASSESETGLSVSVFDGQTAHKINLEAYEPDNDGYLYWDPWGDGSFLQRENNRAGVQARQDPVEHRDYRVTTGELQRVLHYVVIEKNDLAALYKYTQAIKRDPTSQTQALATLKRSRQLNDHQRKIRSAEQKLKDNPDSFEAAQNLCHEFDSLGDFLLASGSSTSADIESALFQYNVSYEFRSRIQSSKPDSIEAASDLMVSCYKMGDAYERLQRFQESANRYAQGLQILNDRLMGQGDDLQNQRNKSVFKERLRNVELASTRPQEVPKIIETAIPEDLPILLTQIATVFAKRNEFATVKDAGDRLYMLAKQTEVSGAGGVETKCGMLYNAACAYSLCSTMVASQTDMGEEDKLKQRRNYLNLAVKCLKESIDAGWNDFEHLKNDTDLLPLHDLPAYQAILPPP